MMQKKETDVIIVGTGVAGLFCALHIPTQYQVLLLTKDTAENSDSFLAQGGISTLKDENDYDTYFEDTMKAGRYENNKDSVKIMIQSSTDIINELIAYGVDFDHTTDGLSYTREGAHSTFRILHHKDITGEAITTVLLEQVKKRPNIQILAHTTMIDILAEKNTCNGVLVNNATGEMTAYLAKTIVLATGGIGGLFQSSTNFPHLTGDGIAICLKHNVAVEQMNYIQIHPTTLYSKTSGRRFLISEAVRGEGAYLLNQKGERFVDELSPRDVVSNAISEEMKKENISHVYLSVTHLPAEKIKSRFPNIYQRCLEEGYDMTKEPIPVIPAQHYFMGGIHTNTLGQTTMKNLYAVGETSCNGVHGANRLASNSLLESLVFAKRAALTFSKKLDEIPLAESYLLPFLSKEEVQQEYGSLVLAEIKRKDEDFYDKWCHHEGAN